MTTITGHAGATAPSLGVPAPAASAQISPTYVARASNGDLAVAQTKAGSVFVYLIPAASEANVFNIQTAPAPSPAFGPLTGGDAYIVAGTGTAGLIAQPGNNQFNNSTTAVATANPIEPTSVAFDPAGNLLIAGENSGGSAIQVVAKTTGTFYGVSMTAGDLYTIADVGVSGAPSTSILMGDVAAASNGLSVDPSGNIVVGDGDGAYFVNEQTSGSLSLYGKTIQHQAAAVIAGNAQGGTDCSTGAAHAAAYSLYFQSAAPYIDSSDNVYLNDNEIGGVNGGGCDWVLPAQTGTFDGQSVTAGNVYKLAGNGGTTATPDGTAGINANVSGTSQMALDLAGNVVLGIQSGTSFGTSPAIQILAQSTCASACAYGLASTTAGDIYTVAGGPSNTLATLSGPTSVLSDGTGNLYFTDGATSSANLDELTGGPTQASTDGHLGHPEQRARGRGATPSRSPAPGSSRARPRSTSAPTPGTSVNVTSATCLSVTVPAGSGTVSVSVITAGGGGSAPAGQRLHLQRAADRHRGQPEQRAAAGGTSVTVTGTGFDRGHGRQLRLHAWHRDHRRHCHRPHGHRSGRDGHGERHRGHPQRHLGGQLRQVTSTPTTL